MVFCHNCGIQHPKGTLFCTNCGSRLLPILPVNETPGHHQQINGKSLGPADLLQITNELNYNANIPTKVPTTCKGCGLPLPDDLLVENLQGHRALVSNVRTITIMFLIPLLGSALILYSIATTHPISSVISLALQPPFIVGAFLWLIPFVMLIVKGKRLLKEVGVTNVYCPSCLEKARAVDHSVTDNRSSSVLASEQMRFYENNLEKGKDGSFKLFAFLLIPGLIFGWLYGTYVKGMDFQSNLIASIFCLILLSVIFCLAISRFRTPQSVGITPTSVVMVLDKGRRVTIPFDKISWVTMVMDSQQLKDPSKSGGSVRVGRSRNLRMTYWVKREIALDIREAYRAYRGVYPPNGLDTKPNPQTRNEAI